MKIVAVRAWPGKAEQLELQVGTGTTVAQLRELVGWDEPMVSIFSERAKPEAVLREGDRVEFLRPLIADPKDTRRKRAEANPLPKTHRQPRSLRAGNQ